MNENQGETIGGIPIEEYDLLRQQQQAMIGNMGVPIEGQLAQLDALRQQQIAGLCRGTRSKTVWLLSKDGEPRRFDVPCAPRRRVNWTRLADLCYWPGVILGLATYALSVWYVAKYVG